MENEYEFICPLLEATRKGVRAVRIFMSPHSLEGKEAFYELSEFGDINMADIRGDQIYFGPILINFREVDKIEFKM